MTHADSLVKCVEPLEARQYLFLVRSVIGDAKFPVWIRLRLKGLYCTLQLSGIRIPNGHYDAELGCVFHGPGLLTPAGLECPLECSHISVYPRKSLDKMAVELPLAPEEFPVERS